MQNFLDGLIVKNKIKIDNNEFFIDYIRKAYNYGKENSQDNDTWTGSVIVKDGKILFYGTNKLPNGIKVSSDKLIRPKKYSYFDHAERNAIYKAAQNGIALNNSTMFMPWVPCCNCAIAIINSGIKTLVMHYPKIIKTPIDWLDDVSTAVNMLLEAGVELIVVKDKIGECEGKFRGEIWYP